jgi:hypothetical protein
MDGKVSKTTQPCLSREILHEVLSKKTTTSL